MIKALIRGRWTWKNNNGDLVKGTHDFNFDDVHDMPWLKGDPSDFEVKDWGWVVIDGEWQEFIKPGFETSTILDTLKKDIS